ncbi:Ppx/GppA phosphatase family protein [Rhodococcus sp. X156]|uniref:Ppx/GppA phosphatase family protein n=1 Tax=Rhodococcus sp. X156 TaxID=2499145 RepID=UPI000FD70E0F|nr:Ppx/GppA phosphatase family protein [Rhodococcus sp. X156]
MRLGVLDVGSNTVHLQVVDAHRGAHPTPMSSTKTNLRLIEYLDSSGHISRDGVDRLCAAVSESAAVAETSRCEEMMAFATSAVRDAGNSIEVLDAVRDRTGVSLQVLSGPDEARLTFLAVRRWCGWSAGRILGLDIGGGSLELALGIDEVPDLALSLPLGAGRLTVDHLRQDPPTRAEVESLREWLDSELRSTAKELNDQGRPDKAVATSKTFRSLARLTGAAPSAAGPRVRRVLTAEGLHQLVPLITRMSGADLAEVDGVSRSRSYQLVAGALVAEAAMRALQLEELEICPWALREGMVLRRLDRAENGL